MPARSPRARHASRVLLAAAALFAAIFAALELDRNAGSGLSILYLLPVVLVGVELGRRAGVLAGLLAFGLFVVWSPSSGVALAPSAFATRALVSVLIGAVAGQLADRLRAVAAEAEASARHFERALDEQRAAEAARREAEERFRRAFDDSATGMAIVGVEGAERDVLLDANESLARILGVARAELIGTHALVATVDPRDAPALAHGMEELLRGAVHRGEYRVVRADGACLWLDLTASLVRDADGRPRYRLVQVLDVTERKTAEERLRFLADHDPLSGLFNRRRFEAELRREVELAASRPRRSVLLLLDVDRFKAINDTLGHGAGDAAIERLGDTLRSRLRSADVVARLGGDEFAAILRRVELPAAREVVRELQAVAARRLATVVGDAHGPVTLSAGLVAIDGESSPDELLRQADRALYAAKAAGRDRVVADGELLAG